MKKAFYFGLVLGCILGIAVALSMDILLGKSLGGGWSEAVANDMNHLFGSHLPQDHFIVIGGVIFIIGIIGSFGALIGGIFLVMIAHLFKMLTKEE
ncbi:MAG: hypothetical protein EPN94_09425 [Nitrospirae bacterium]|nr:MAG: hypothetical protein EPN94_09425 [Nitrospirota bacterium]